MSKKKDTIDKHVLFLVTVVMLTVILLVTGLFFYNFERKKYFVSQYADMEGAFNSLLLSSQESSPNSKILMERYSIRWLLFYRAFYTNPVDPYDNDQYWRYSMNLVNSHVILADEMVRKGYYDSAYQELLYIKGIWNSVFMRNNTTAYEVLT